MANRPSARSTRTVLVIDESLHAAARWFDQLQSTYAVVTISSLAGASIAINGREVAAIVIVLIDGYPPARNMVTALRSHSALESTAIFVVGSDVSMIGAELCGLTNFDVITPEQADYELPLRVVTAASRMSSRPAPRRASAPNPGSLRSSDAATIAARAQSAARFSQDSIARGERGLVLCELLSRRDGRDVDRRKAAGELSSLLATIRSEALLLQLSELASVVLLAEQAVGRLHVLSGQVVVPRGVSGLLSALRELGRGPDALLRFDVELHRTRLAAGAVGRPPGSGR